MWDYDKLFAISNVLGVFNKTNGRFGVGRIDEINIDLWKDWYANSDLTYKNESETLEAEIQYIIRLDEHGNVVERLFDRERDIPPSMPELKHGMIIKINYKDKETLGYVDKHRGLVVYQDGTYDTIDSHKDWMETDIVAIYDDVECFNQCDRYDPIWEKSN